MKWLAGVAALVAVVLGVSASLGGQGADAATIGSGPGFASGASWPEWPPFPTVRSSRLLLGGRLRCTASVASLVQAGQPMVVRFVLRNVSRHPVKRVGFGDLSVSLVLRAGDGTTYDTDVAFGLDGYPSPPVVRGGTLPRGARWGALQSVLVRWSGPLQVTPSCWGKPLPVLEVGVTAPGPPPSDGSSAVAEVVAATDHLLDQCRPQEPGVSVDGQIDPLNGNAPPMPAQCSVSLSDNGQFWVAQLLVLSPPDLQGVQVGSYETLPYPPSIDSRPLEAIAWEFLVTQTQAIPLIGASEWARGPSQQLTPVWWTPAGWQVGQAGAGAGCGAPAFGLGYSFGITPGPYFQFPSNCPGP